MGFFELLLIFIVGILVFGPKELIIVARKIGQFLKAGKKLLQSIQENFQQHLKLHENEQKAHRVDLFYKENQKKNQHE